MTPYSNRYQKRVSLHGLTLFLGNDIEVDPNDLWNAVGNGCIFLFYKLDGNFDAFLFGVLRYFIRCF